MDFPLCPKCRKPLEEILDQETPFLGCTTCFGLFVSELELEGYVRKEKSEAGAAFATLLAKAVAARKAGPLGPRQCPVCGAGLARLGFGTDDQLVVIDRCASHGIWLDRTELKKVVRASVRATPRSAGAPDESRVAADDDLDLGHNTPE